MSTTKITVLIIPVLLLGLFIFRGPHVILSLSTATADIANGAKGQEQSLDLPKCEPDAQGNIDQTLTVNKGDTGSFYWAEVAGCVSRPFLDTWGVTHNPAEMGVSDLAKSIVKAIVPPPAGASHLYRVSYTVQDFITISWTLDWLHQILQGTLAAPKEVLITISKYDGSSLIQHFAGSIRLLQIAPQVTLAATRLEVKVPQANPDKVAQGGTEIIGRLRVGTPYWDGMSSSQLVDFE